MLNLTKDELATLKDIAEPDSCLIHDGPTIEGLLEKGLIVWDATSTCYRATVAGIQAMGREDRLSLKIAVSDAD